MFGLSTRHRAPKRLIKRRAAFRTSLERLEDRVVCDATNVLAGNALVIEGTNANDYVQVQYDRSVDRVAVLSATANGPVRVTEYARSDVRGIVFHGYDGNDQFQNLTNIPL